VPPNVGPASGSPSRDELPETQAVEGGGDVGAKVGGTRVLTLNFDDSDDEVFDDKANDECPAHLSGLTINVEIGEKISCNLGDRVSTGKCFYFCMCLSLSLLVRTSYVHLFCREYLSKCSNFST
jgi:hypothetical protein